LLADSSYRHKETNMRWKKQLLIVGAIVIAVTATAAAAVGAVRREANLYAARALLTDVGDRSLVNGWVKGANIGVAAPGGRGLGGSAAWPSPFSISLFGRCLRRLFGVAAVWT
jgi:hypothetical protein